MSSLVLIAHNLRSSHNVGSLLRTAEGLGVAEVYLTGYTPYPLQKNDTRLPHMAKKLSGQIAKTSLGAEKSVGLHHADIAELISELSAGGYEIAALEQTPDALALPKFKAPGKLALIVGREVEGLESKIVELCDLAIEIPMSGNKESFNVAVAAAIALYHCKYHN